MEISRLIVSLAFNFFLVDGYNPTSPVDILDTVISIPIIVVIIISIIFSSHLIYNELYDTHRLQYFPWHVVRSWDDLFINRL